MRQLFHFRLDVPGHGDGRRATGRSWRASEATKTSSGGTETATLEITNGGLVKSTDGALGLEYRDAPVRFSRGTARVKGTGSTWELSATLWVGAEGIGTLEITTAAW